MRTPFILSAALVGLGLTTAGCGGDRRNPDEMASRDERQELEPVKAVETHICAHKFVAGDPGRQVKTHLFVKKVDDDVQQAVIYDGDGDDAKLIGVEYIISRDKFESLPDEEKRLWHSHAYEVKAGLVDMPGIDAEDQDERMEELVATYGKTYYTWQTDKDDSIPLGPPQLLMSFTQDGQVDESLIDEDDVEERRNARADLQDPGVLTGADQWEEGTAIQLDVVERRGEPGSVPASAPRRPEPVDEPSQQPSTEQQAPPADREPAIEQPPSGTAPDRDEADEQERRDDSSVIDEDERRRRGQGFTPPPPTVVPSGKFADEGTTNQADMPKVDAPTPADHGTTNQVPAPPVGGPQ